MRAHGHAAVPRLRQRGYAGAMAAGISVRGCGRLKACPQGTAVRDRPCPSWPSRRASLTPRRATWLVLRREAKRTEAEAQQLAAACAQQAEVTEAIDLAQDFRPWSASGNQRLTLAARATASTLRPCNALRKDCMRTMRRSAGVTLPWSTGPVEGHINRLKMLKRQMFGRARLDLLSRRFVEAPRGGQAQAARPPAPSQAHAAPHSHAGRQRHRGEV